MKAANELEKYIGIDLGGTSIKMGVINQQGEILHTIKRTTPATEGYEKVIETFDEMLKDMIQEKGYEWQQFKGVGIGVPGPVHVEEGIVLEAVNLGWNEEVPLKELLLTKWGIPVALDNDANVAALGEMWVGAGKGAAHLLCMTIGTGVGGGVIINSDIYHGAGGIAGEVGHLTVNAQDGRMCNCGKKGCLETEASATAIVNQVIERLEQISSPELKAEYEQSGTLSAKHVIELARQHEPVCVEIISQVGQTIGKALAEICVILNPEVIVIGGGVSYAGELLFEPLTRSFEANAFSKLAEKTRITQAKLGNNAGMIGAAYLVKRELISKEGSSHE